MLKNVLAACCILALAGTAAAEDKSMGSNTAAKTGEAKPAGEMKPMGPMSRKVTKEDKKGIDELYKSWEDAWKKGDINAVADLVDFPVVMVTDNSKGEFMHTTMDREAFTKAMGGSMSGMPKDMKMSSKHSARFLSDTLAAVDEDNSMSAGKMKGSWKAESLVINKDGKWKFKELAEAGWGDTMGPGAASSGGQMDSGGTHSGSR